MCNCCRKEEVDQINYAEIFLTAATKLAEGISYCDAESAEKTANTVKTLVEAAAIIANTPDLF